MLTFSGMYIQAGLLSGELKRYFHCHFSADCVVKLNIVETGRNIFLLKIVFCRDCMCRNSNVFGVEKYSFSLFLSFWTENTYLKKQKTTSWTEDTFQLKENLTNKCLKKWLAFDALSFNTKWKKIVFFWITFKSHFSSVVNTKMKVHVTPL